MKKLLLSLGTIAAVAAPVAAVVSCKAMDKIKSIKDKSIKTVRSEAIKAVRASTDLDADMKKTDIIEIQNAGTIAEIKAVSSELKDQVAQYKLEHSVHSEANVTDLTGQIDFHKVAPTKINLQTAFDSMGSDKDLITQGDPDSLLTITITAEGKSPLVIENVQVWEDMSGDIVESSGVSLIEMKFVNAVIAASSAEDNDWHGLFKLPYKDSDGNIIK